MLGILLIFMKEIVQGQRERDLKKKIKQNNNKLIENKKAEREKNQTKIKN